MTVYTESVMLWLRRQRTTVQLQLQIMASLFDLEGALDAEQPGLAWAARQDLLAAAVEMHLHFRGIPREPAADEPERICLLLHALARVDGALAEEAWALLEEQAPLDADQRQRDLERTTAFMTGPLAIAAAASRDAATRAWAEAIKLLRDVAKRMGIAQAEDWYLPDGDAQGRLDWYDEVINLLDAKGSA